MAGNIQNIIENIKTVLIKNLNSDCITTPFTDPLCFKVTELKYVIASEEKQVEPAVFYRMPMS